jgi:hypothetical protein
LPGWAGGRQRGRDVLEEMDSNLAATDGIHGRRLFAIGGSISSFS